MNGGWFSCQLVGLTEDGRRVDASIRHQGDPGNRATVKFLCESALALALDADTLPGGRRRGGVLTPATALGDVLVGRLRRAGVGIEVREAARRGGDAGPRKAPRIVGRRAPAGRPRPAARRTGAAEP